ncbi:MAG: ABC transporter ATP-binding protein, partial [Confluentibacter sp.]|nr:ABC transporter ATP-binding protein [Confluentibacter sp.]
FRVYDDSQPAVSNTSEDKKEKNAWKKTEASKLSFNEEKELKNIESKLNALAFDKKELESQFHNPDLTPENINKLSEALQKIIDEIEAKETRWFELSSKLEG